MILTVWIITVIAFVIIQLPPGDYVTNMISEMMSQGSDRIDPVVVEQLRDQYGLNDPVYVQYYKWMKNIVTEGNFGYSLTFRRDAKVLILERLPLTFLVTSPSVLLVWIVSLPIRLFSAVRQHSTCDYLATFIGFIGVATSNFLFALILMYLSYRYGGRALIGLFSKEYVNAPWSGAKFIDLLKHMIIPVIIIGTSFTAGLIRTMRANLL